PINYAELNQLSEDFGKRFVPQQELSDEQSFRLQTSHHYTDQSASSPVKIEAPRELPKRNKEEIETISLDDLYNNLKIYEPELAGSLSTSQNPQNVAFVSSNSTNSNCNSITNEADNTAYGVSTAHTQCKPTSGDNLSNVMICAFLASQSNSAQLAREDLEQIDPDDLEEMDLQ
ncbi:hypothetical protein Tco_1226159, partial [Tanacetum coccineum]